MYTIFKILSLTYSQENCLCTVIDFHFPRHLNYVATLPCEIWKLKTTAELILLPEKMYCFTWNLAKLNKVHSLYAKKHYRFDLFNFHDKIWQLSRLWLNRKYMLMNKKTAREVENRHSNKQSLSPLILCCHCVQQVKLKAYREYTLWPFHVTVQSNKT